MARFRRSIREAREAYERECRSACSRGNVCSKTFREAFGRTRPPRLLPPLERPDGTFTTTHLESAALLLRSQIAVDDARDDLPEHATVRGLAEEPYGPDNDDVPFTAAEVRAVLARTPSRSSPGPDEITPRLMRGIFDAHTPSAVSALVRLRERLAELKAARTPAVMMALDFQGAFDSVWHPGVLRFFRGTFLRDRTVVFISNAGEIEAHPSLGSPQGSPLSPMLWNVTIHDLLDLPLPTGVTLQAYADDTVTIVPAQNRETVAELGSRVLHQVIGWAAAARVVVITSGDRSLTYKDAIRVLGVVFDGRLSFFKHADHLREKAEVTVGKIAALAHMQGGRLRPEQKTSLYRGVFLPGVMYASPVWWDRTWPDCRLRSRLASIQRAAMLGILGAYRTTRTAALQVLLNAPPIALELERANAEYDLVVQRTPVSFGDISFTPDEIMPPVDIWQEHPAARMYCGYRRLTRDGARRLARAPGMHVYTDGSYSDRAAGAAFVVLGPGDRVAATGRYRVERATSAYCAEVTAMIEALHYIRDRYVTADVRALSRDRTADGRVYDIKTALRDIAARAKIWLYHVPGHSGVLAGGSEGADTPDLVNPARDSGSARAPREAPMGPRLDGKQLRHVPVSLGSACVRGSRVVPSEQGAGNPIDKAWPFNLSRDPHCACGHVCDGVDHYIFECPMTRHLTGRLQTREDFDNRRYEALLERRRPQPALALTSAPTCRRTERTVAPCLVQPCLCLTIMVTLIPLGDQGQRVTSAGRAGTAKVDTVNGPSGLYSGDDNSLTAPARVCSACSGVVLPDIGTSSSPGISVLENRGSHRPGIPRRRLLEETARGHSWGDSALPLFPFGSVREGPGEAEALGSAAVVS
ncbi:hypothetical protein HPB50_028115 [Hyalomma asiaticum]|nr:hypothetical protein HPB50_028115 [Hyalomma asiaticum]